MEKINKACSIIEVGDFGFDFLHFSGVKTNLVCASKIIAGIFTGKS